ncbi:MAG: HAD hydrolase-like protein [Candidatus Riflebacteria bacterium]|nr:HAD hydrolase-like protein [Candidatus Riflebacteria bacterium]
MSAAWNRLLLFDIDGTLLSADRSGYQALERSVVEVLGAPRGLEGIRLDGNTDLNALRQVTTRDGLPFPAPEVIERFKNRYVEILAAGIQGRGHLKPGVEDLLNRLADNPAVCLGLVTGNFREGARIKLARFGLERHFRLGAYGCEDPARAALVRLAMDRAAAARGAPFPPGAVTVIGDTVHDVAASRECGVRALGVATGSCPVGGLLAAGATWALPDLSETDRVERLLLS